MALTIETGAPLTGADSYATESEYSTYLADYGYTASGTPEVLLRRAFRFMQSLDWLLDHDYYYTVETPHKNGQCEIAYRLAQGADDAAEPSQAVKRKRIDVIDTEFFAGSSKSTSPAFLVSMPAAYGILKDYLSVGGYMGRS